MVEYGNLNSIKSQERRNPPPVIFGIPFGEVSYLDYEPDSKLKVSQDDLLIFFRQMAVMLKSNTNLQ